MHDSRFGSFKNRAVLATILATFVTLVVMLADFFHVLPAAPDKFIYDWKVSLLSTKLAFQRRDITIIYIDEASLAEYPYKSPIDRALIASLIRAIDQTKPKAIGIDIIFDRPTEPDRDDALLRTIRDTKAPLVLIGTDQSESGIGREAFEWQSTFLEKTNKTVSTAFFSVEESTLSLADNVIRTMDRSNSKGKERKPFALALAQQTGNYQLPQSLLIDWLLPSSGGREAFQTLTIPRHKKVSVNADVEAVLPQYMRATLENKIVIVAGNLTGSDWHQVPMTVMNGFDVPGAFIHAQIVAQILDGRQIVDAPRLFTIVVVFLAAFLLYLSIETFTGKLHKVLLETLIIGCTILFGAIMFWEFRISFPSAHLLTVWLFISFFGEPASKLLMRLQKRLRKVWRLGQWPTKKRS